MKKLVVIHESLNISPLYPLFKSLINGGLELLLFSNDKKNASQFKEINVQVKKLRFCKKLNSNLSALRYLFFLPFYFVFNFFWLYRISRKSSGQPVTQDKVSLLCFGEGTQMLFPLLSSIFKLKLVIFCNPEDKQKPFLVRLLIKIFSRWGLYWVLSNHEKEILSKTLSKKAKIIVLPLGVNLSANEQDNLFSRLANAKRDNLSKKYFSVGTVVADDSGHLESLLAASKNCLNVIKELQLIVICDIKIKNKMQWLTKKLEIDSLVWFVGKETLQRKWCSNLDVFVSLDYNFSLFNFYHILSAQANQVPIIAPNNESMQELVTNNKSGILVDTKDSEKIAQAIIDLYRSHSLRRRLGEKAVEIIEEKYTLDKMKEEFLKIYTQGGL